MLSWPLLVTGDGGSRQFLQVPEQGFTAPAPGPRLLDKDRVKWSGIFLTGSLFSHWPGWCWVRGALSKMAGGGSRVWV